MFIKTKIIKCFEKEYPKKLLEIKDYPQQLHCVGKTSLLNHKKIVAIVGSRNCTEYGKKYARIFAKELAKANICIISGLALGIDAAAHYGALTEVGGTIAVLGGGLKHIYPKENIWLFNQILEEGGCVITEHNEDEEADRLNFPTRNRIISGIADAVLVIEAAHRSGSKITAQYAKRQGKRVYCIPTNLDGKNSVGINELIRDNAKIVTTPNHLINDLFYNEIQTEEHKKIEKKECEQIKILEMPENYKDLYEFLKETKTREEIVIKLNKDISEINSLLTTMELEGYIKQTAGNNFQRI